ncbi:hypothetical protein [Nonomuraea sp. 10N515B]|uniref:hypothetical protein n=1 Tax=Nonomuraea sp. 10N515B TaxID=3457422 RepID=UPI003FCCE8DA
MIGLPGAIPAEVRERLVPRSHPSWVEPSLATLTHAAFSDPDWIFEPSSTASGSWDTAAATRYA